MLLPDLVIKSKINLYIENIGMDTYKQAFDKTNFIKYPYKINYRYNSRGFRDIEWPANITNETIWCVGDSFTVGVGCAFEHTWVNLLRKNYNKECINISMDGASNRYISRKACSIIENIKPNHLILHWSYFHRRENLNFNMKDEDRILFVDEISDERSDYNDTVECINMVENFAKINKTKILHSFVPNAVHKRFMFKMYDFLRTNKINFIKLEQIDFGRDGHHYGIETHSNFVKTIVKSKFLDI